MNVAEVVKKEIQSFAPSSFALVMSTGIISIASHLLGFTHIAYFLFYLNNALYIILIVLFSIRVVLFFLLLVQDISAHAKGAGFLTITAASCLLGMQHALLQQNFKIAEILWFAALFFWLVLMYGFFISVVAKTKKPSLEEGLNGSWLLLVVSTQSLSILANTISAHLPFSPDLTTLITFSAFLLGFIFYVILITLIFQRLIFSPLKAEEFIPPDWIDMGAAAITALSAATMNNTLKTTPSFSEFGSFVKTISLLAWTVSTWWIPIVFILEIRRHLTIKKSFKYQASYWSLVFPVGVYTACSIRVGEAFKTFYLHVIAQYFIFIAFTVWILVFISMCFKLIQLFISPPRKY